MTVVAKGEDELMALVNETARPVVLEALEDHSMVAEESLSHARAAADRTDWEQRLALLGEMRRQIEGTVGQVHMTGPEDLVTRVLKTATSNATHDLDTLIESLSGTSAPLDIDGRERLREHAAVAATCVETLIACEGSRRHQLGPDRESAAPDDPDR
jgi:hypothetical protein